jgi:hypothetical protein
VEHWVQAGRAIDALRGFIDLLGRDDFRDTPVFCGSFEAID